MNSSPLRTALRRSLWIVLAFAGMLISVEFGIRLKNDGGLAGLNVFENDGILGLRMTPNTTTRLAYKGGPAMDIHINSDGYRGPDFPPLGGPEILVVGDSLTFGLGVEDDQTFSAQLQGLLGSDIAVHNLGVPGYGPLEMEAVATELLESRRPRIIVFTYGLARQGSTVDRPLLEQFTSRYGWVVPVASTDSAQDQTEQDGEFLGRRRDVADEGATWPFSWLHQYSHAVDELRRWKASQEFAEQLGDETTTPSGVKLVGRIPGVSRAPTRESRSAFERWKFLVQWAQRIPQTRLQWRGTPWEIWSETGQLRTWASVSPILLRLEAQAQAMGARVVLLAIPADVQVHVDEWHKYGLDRLDKAKTTTADAVLEDLVASARALGIATVDGAEVLRPLGNGCFVEADWHMSVQGHTAIAQALAQKLSEPPPIRTFHEDSFPMLTIPPAL
ncbi:MAG: hypothetical protein QGG40_12145 [Myxococcota bacterium]|nr:hypothetical protein [Myxococcota bacterium]